MSAYMKISFKIIHSRRGKLGGINAPSVISLRDFVANRGARNPLLLPLFSLNVCEIIYQYMFCVCVYVCVCLSCDLCHSCEEFSVIFTVALATSSQVRRVGNCTLGNRKFLFGSMCNDLNTFYARFRILGTLRSRLSYVAFLTKKKSKYKKQEQSVLE